jgi:YihY family inner membrane protein
LSYGLFAPPDVVADNIRGLFGVLPRDAAKLIADQLTNVVGTSGSKKGWALILALALALYGGTQGASAIVNALNVAYEEKESRGFVKLYILAFAITGAAVLLAIMAAAASTAVAFLGGLMPSAPGIVVTAIGLVGYLILGIMAVTAAAMLYRYGPDRKHAKWVWLTPGSFAATALWLAATAIFAFYVANFGSYGATYGSLGAVVFLQLWLWLSAYIFLLGAELNSQLERRTAKDTTTGPPAPPGQRGAAVADAVGSEVASPEVREVLENK